MNYDQIPQNNERLESEKIIQKLQLETGRTLSIQKIASNDNSDIDVGDILEGKLKNNVRIGFPVEFNNNKNTSDIKSVKIENGKYLIETRTSIYEVLDKVSEKKIKQYFKI